MRRSAATRAAIETSSVKCERCGYDRAEHEHANLSDGAFVSRYLLICPTAIFKATGYDMVGRKDQP